MLLMFGESFFCFWGAREGSALVPPGDDAKPRAELATNVQNTKTKQSFLAVRKAMLPPLG